MTETVATFTAAQVRATEAPLLAAGVPLMRRAAAALAEVIAEHNPERMLVLAGSGDNGGDALFAAAGIAAGGIRVDILRTSDRVHEEALQAATDGRAASDIRCRHRGRPAQRSATPTPASPKTPCSPRRRR